MIRTGEWISEGWELVKQDLVLHIVLMLIVGAAGTATAGILQPMLMCGYIYIIIRKLQEPGYSIEIGDIGKGFEVFVQALLAGIVGGLISMLGLIGCVVGVFVTTALVMFAMPLVMDRRMEFWPAIQASMDKVKEDLMGWAVFVLALSGVNLLGALVCGVGTLVTGPITIVALVLAYRDNFGFAGAATDAATQPAPPPTPTQ